MQTELLAQIVEELSIRNAQRGYKQPRTIPRPDYLTGKKAAAASTPPAGSQFTAAIERMRAAPPPQGGARWR